MKNDFSKKMTSIKILEIELKDKVIQQDDVDDAADIPKSSEDWKVNKHYDTHLLVIKYNFRITQIILR